MLQSVTSLTQHASLTYSCLALKWNLTILNISLQGCTTLILRAADALLIFDAWLGAGRFNQGISSLQAFHNFSEGTLLCKISPPWNTHSHCAATHYPHTLSPGFVTLLPPSVLLLLSTIPNNRDYLFLHEGLIKPWRKLFRLYFYEEVLKQDFLTCSNSWNI